ncbi:MAG: YdcF family protein [Alphaproteobacteria bacterium]|nr:YdcF family protein [Alphaproteobacteria bacterium]
MFTIPQPKSLNPTKTEAIVVLTGGRERLKTGFNLLCNQQAKVIFISGVNREETLKSLLKTVDLPAMTCPIDKDQLIASTHLGYWAKNTKENALETAGWVNERSISSLRLVTADYHMPRSLMEMMHQLPEITIIPHPVFPFGQSRFRWLFNEGAFLLIFSEYNKFLWGFTRRHFSD